MTKEKTLQYQKAYVELNEILKSLEVINISNLHEVFINTIIMLLFSILFIIINNIVTKKKRVIA